MPLPLTSPKPDCERFVAALSGRTILSRPPLIEYLVDVALMRPIVQDILGRRWVTPEDGDSRRLYLDNFIAFWQRLGYDFVRLEMGLPFPRQRIAAPDSAPGVVQMRNWADQHHGAIASWADYERYPWPRLEDFDFSPFEYVNAHMPEGMGLIVSHGGGPYEHLSDLFSYEGLCLALHDQRDLVKAVADRVGALMLGFYQHLVDLDRLIVVFPGDDMGFRTATLIAPDDLRALTLPWHARFAGLAHDRDKLYFLHSCGNIFAIMPDLMDTVGIDGKHSFEDAILPADRFQERYGDRIAVLGGVDVDVLACGTVEEVRQRTRWLIDTCGPRGRFAIGSGNSIPSYIPVPSYLAMLEEALR
ncbi:MAG: uroporphyrinogen decarboxylase family protein [Anaerolineae bacterium]